MKTLLKNTDSPILEKTFSEICIELDNRKRDFENSGRKGDDINQTWNNFLERNTTFLTSK